MLTIRPATCAENNLQANFEFMLTLKSTSKEQEDAITEKNMAMLINAAEQLFGLVMIRGM